VNINRINQQLELADIKSKSSVDSLKVDSITIYTAVFVPNRVFYSFYRYEDSLFCNYDSLKKQAFKRKQVFKCHHAKDIVDSIGMILNKNKVFIQQYNFPKLDTSIISGKRICHIDFRREGISDLFEIYIRGKMIRLGVRRDNYYEIFVNNHYINLKKKKTKELHRLLYKYRAISLTNCKT
jgi:hypothetical protein